MKCNIQDCNLTAAHDLEVHEGGVTMHLCYKHWIQGRVERLEVKVNAIQNRDKERNQP